MNFMIVKQRFKAKRPDVHDHRRDASLRSARQITRDGTPKRSTSLADCINLQSTIYNLQSQISGGGSGTPIISPYQRSSHSRAS